MVQGGSARYCSVRCSDTMNSSRGLVHLGTLNKETGEYKNTATPGFNGGWRICFSVDGLVMLKCDHHNKLMLWNPSISKCRLVPDSQGSKFIELGIGFDPLIKDYKLVRVSRSRRTPSSVEIYTVGTASWKTVAAQGALPSTWPQGAIGRRPIYFKGCLCILSSTKLISFNLSREVFKSVDLLGHKKSAHEDLGDSLAFVDEGSSLAVLHFSYPRGSVWLLDDNAAFASSWTMRCTFDMAYNYNDFLFLYLKKNGNDI